MDRKYNMRSADSVARSLRQTSVHPVDDLPSDNEEDKIICQSHSASEEDEACKKIVSSTGGDMNNTLDESALKNEDELSPKRRRLDSAPEPQPAITPNKTDHNWSLKPRERLPPRPSPNVPYTPGPLGAAREKQTPLEFWELLFDPEILYDVVLHTNQEISRYRLSTEIEMNLTNAHIYKDLTISELKASLGLLYFSGLQKTNNTNLEDLWSYEFGPTLYRATMPLRRFKVILSSLRFDDKSTRDYRRETDKLAPIRDVWQQFVSNCRKYYSPHSSCSIDAQLVPFGGRCPFRMSSPEKPNEYGMKIVMLNDSKTYYMHNAEPCTGNAIGKNSNETLSSYCVRKLSEPIHGTGRNLTCEDWLTSVETVQKMLREYSLTMIGTIRKGERGIPGDFKRPGGVGSSKFAFDDSKILVSFTPERNKVMLLVSSLHETAGINSDTGQPEVLTMYKETKGGTKGFDQFCREYTTARKTHRWPMRLWYTMLDQAGVNAMILYNSNSANRTLTRGDFLKALFMGLIQPHLLTRLASPHLRRELRVSISKILHMEEPENEPGSSKLDRQIRCSLCPRSKDKKVKTACSECRRPACEEHRRALCVDCVAHD
ncbi:uncharacterized protein LOC114841719 [Diachasma alloeum]|uniref:uncharacterized protein LOC114841719 n=1 Tax=Diachasma alloeum TaxID=454923 RepID=UPI0010FB0D0C|nr:uncharacterized protein LOC114841719 [Diachasma alloeum]